MPREKTIEMETLYAGSPNAKLDELPLYEERAREKAGLGNSVILTGQAPIWLYLKVAHTLHGKAARLSYLSPVAGLVVIFDHSPY